MLASAKVFNLNKFLFILIISVIIISYNCNIAYCADEVNNNSEIVVNPILDTPITVQTTPRQIGKFLLDSGLSGGVLYGAYTGAKMLPYVNSIYPGNIFTKGAMGLTLITTGSLLGLGAYVIGQRFGPRGPYVNVTIGSQRNIGNNTSDQGAVVSEANNTTAPETLIGCPLEINEIAFNPFTYINPLSEDPDIALLSISILMLILGIQCINLILIRIAIIKNSLRILSYLKGYPLMYKFFEKVVLILEKTYKFYVVGFSILAYLNIAGGTIFLLFLLGFLTHST